MKNDGCKKCPQHTYRGEDLDENIFHKKFSITISISKHFDLKVGLFCIFNQILKILPVRLVHPARLPLKKPVSVPHYVVSMS